ncbi:MAG: hypothetical protein NC548_25285 [Lachnospiraceae bacterium]|nr:hypothetical protein [Lachnospiraceae bacterium]
MDREMKESVKALERGAELAQEEGMRGRAAAQALTGTEESRDVDAEIVSLRRKLNWARVQAAVLVLAAAAVIVARLI